VFSVCCEDFFVIFKRGFLLKKALKEDVYILLSLAIDDITYSVVRRWEGCKKLLEHLRLIKRVFHGRVNGLNHSRQTLDVSPGILDIIIFGHLVGHEFVKILPVNRGFIIIVFLLKYVPHVFYVLTRFHALSVHIADTDVDGILYFRVSLLKVFCVGHRCSDNCYSYSLSFKVFFQ
jgi:hypothetical protein